ncbi:S-adenosyl-L-methionine-dependent methyltransferase [Paraphoma chrysanthemicola]|uniref:S-adenosyl-L-methionine-dependent methyltransferase n=1 Tax=Paraphoma chrysanthemicola TaxID=798071 RepID=A0A8K0VT93_9PLEO|nr:S-adenosyl-L-methionine-dependent methyltransferase [Paraphoma chrysanthemicola]
MSDDSRTVTIHGRDFQQSSIDEKIYCAPVANDDREEERLTTQHDILRRLFGDAILSPSVRLNDPTKVLDCGYGGGDWSVEFAEEYEDCEVTGLDIFPLRLVDQPDNLDLVGYNLNDRLNDPEVFRLRAYDLIHSRFVAPGIKRNRWPSYFRDIRNLLRSGGYVQVVEYQLHILSNNGRLTDQSAVYQWWREYVAAMRDLNREPRIGPSLKGHAEAAGFRNVQVEYRRLPIGSWEQDPVLAGIGRDSVGLVGDLLDSLGLWPFTAHLGWTASRFNDLIQQVRAELQNVELQLYLPM